MSFDPVPLIVEDLCRGKMVIVLDDGRENEGDLAITARAPAGHKFQGATAGNLSV